MQVQVDSAGVIIAYGLFTADHPDPSIRIVEIDDTLAPTFEQPGTKTLNQDGTITVTPPAPDLAAHAALMEQRANDAHDHALIRAAATGHAPIDQAFAAAVARQLGSLNG